jgi:hypothetical protein
MSVNKNQHFLPQHYLRLFSTDGGKNIAITILDSLKFVIGPISGQCQEDWFYREDGELDLWLKETEDAYGLLLPEIIETRKLTVEQLMACRFLAVLYCIRTKKATEIHGLFSRRMFFDVVNEGIRTGAVPPPPPDWSMKTVGVKGVSGFLVKNIMIQCFLETCTLQCKLLEPSGSARFITSDHPSVCMNQLMAEEEKRNNRSYTGFSRSGFQLILPLAPTLCLFFFDPKVYKVGNKRESLVRVADQDVELVNSLQVQSADRCLYSSQPSTSQAMQNLVKKFGVWRRPTDDLLQVTQLSDTEDFYHVKSPTSFLAFPWVFCKLQRRPRIHKSKRREPDWTMMVDAFIKSSDKIKSDDILKEFVEFVKVY